jgi:hypothetical protein
MTDAVTLDIGNITKFVAELRALPPILQSNLARGAAKAAMTELRDRAVAKAPMRAGPEGGDGGPPPGNLKKAIYCMRLPELCTLTREVWKVDARKGKGKWKHKRNQGKDTNTAGAYYAGFVEYGHWSRTPASVLSAVGGTRNSRRQKYQASGQAKWIPAVPFMRPALDSMRSDFTSIMQDYVDRNIREAVKVSKFMTVRG